MKKSFILLFIFLSAFSAKAQNTELVLEKGVSAHREVDALYKSLSEAYRTLDDERITDLYSENAQYLPPDNDVLQGIEQIRPSFKSFFEWIRKENQTMTISFQILQRKIDKNIGYDVGIYTIRQYKDGTEVKIGKGKFIVITAKGKDRKWRFQVDGYNGLKTTEKK